MSVGIRVGSNTSGTRSLHPWLIESNYRQVTLHLGGIYDRQSYENTGRIEYVSRRAMPKRSVTNRVGAQSSSFGSYNSQRERSGLTGNTPYVYYKNGLGMADNGDSVAGQTVVYNAGLFQNGSYIVLRKTVNIDSSYYWSLGVIERADLSVTPKDIVIGYVKNTFVTQIWSSDIYPYVTEDVREEFACQINEEEPSEEGGDKKYMLRIQKGTVEYDRYKTNDKGIINPDSVGGLTGGKATRTHYIKYFSVFETGKLTAGPNVSSKFIEDGKIELTPNKNYNVFVYKITPDWENSLESMVPQLCVSAEDGAPNTTIKTQINGSGLLQNYVEVKKKTLQLPVIGEGDVIGTFNAGEIGIDFDINDYSSNIWTIPDSINVKSNISAVDVVDNVESKGVGYIKTDCYRQDIARITWVPDDPEEETPGPGKFTLVQIHIGSINLRQNPVGPIKTKNLSEGEEAEWTGSYDTCVDIKGSFDGYTKTLVSGPSAP